MNDTSWKEVIGSKRRLVIKIGSAVLASDLGLDETIIIQIADQVARLRSQGIDVVIVSSGAIAAGILRLGGKIRPKTIPEKQALAAVGQGRLMEYYESAFSRFGIVVAQVLLTRDGLVARRRYTNAKNTIQTLLRWGIIPIINENDTVATDEIQFTDNDALSVLVVDLADADLLITLSDIDGLYSEDPRKNPEAEILRVVEDVSDEIIKMAGNEPGRAGRGGMRSKLEAARLVTASGVPMVIAKGRRPECLLDIVKGKPIGTLFLPKKRPILHGKKPWIACTLDPEGVLYLDDGAVRAIEQGGKSLLPVGITSIEGDFEQGDCVVCKDCRGRKVATGIISWNSKDLKNILGLRSEEISAKLGLSTIPEVIHRDNMVVLGGSHE
ncbi:Glutamate 5-kinase [Dissulfuribacter thermophilus]|uniref:Glutamate 5-kinase n=1 Tax=Dissulfuribacter thermophilus TaxID=1156395 RepID=A0A1B9F834_9BACT|nr:glutamate 5-kinase [Dissulfuribacter thermophilus]OCC15931.1 Glutamate 5-kinase [Dissulfuribacter thermophilus]